ncbi:hypothetical protein ACHAXA_007226 [Cyclostephanos tholiformis]|uniref:Uncharacterized protein n=1 Tax=Cyclostephanos tholiformis TaxID=382380 RepID=A0ABD3RMV9_9STRA
MNPLFHLVTMDYPYALESACLAMSIQGSLSVRNGPNRKNTMNWFHAFVRSTLTAYAGATFANVFMGRPTSMLSNDVFFGSCILGYALINCLPFDAGYRLFNDTFPGMLFVSTLSQVFRAGGICGFSDAAHDAFESMPSSYYPIPLFGPILLPTILGNVGGFLWHGFDGYLGDGMPWLFQQGISCSTFYHLYAHDESGILGTTLRAALRPMAMRIMHVVGTKDYDDDIDDSRVAFARFVIGTFMVMMSILHMPHFLGPNFSPFVSLYCMIVDILGGFKMNGRRRRRGRGMISGRGERGTNVNVGRAVHPPNGGGGGGGVGDKMRRKEKKEKNQ